SVAPRVADAGPAAREGQAVPVDGRRDRMDLRLGFRALIGRRHLLEGIAEAGPPARAGLHPQRARDAAPVVVEEPRPLGQVHAVHGALEIEVEASGGVQAGAAAVSPALEAAESEEVLAARVDLG